MIIVFFHQNSLNIWSDFFRMSVLLSGAGLFGDFLQIIWLWIKAVPALELFYFIFHGKFPKNFLKTVTKPVIDLSLLLSHWGILWLSLTTHSEDPRQSCLAVWTWIKWPNLVFNRQTRKLCINISVLAKKLLQWKRKWKILFHVRLRDYSQHHQTHST